MTAERIAIVGMGEIGRRFAAGADALGIPYTAITRDARVPNLVEPGRATILCVRETDLADVLVQIPPDRSADLVFVQNGFIEELTARYPDATRAVLWFTSKRGFFADLLPSPVFGPRAALVRDLVHAAGGSAEALADQDVFRRYALEKAIWACIVGPPLAVWGLDLEHARHERMGDLEAIVTEACNVVRLALGVEISPQRVLATIDDTSHTLGWMRGSTRALALRNGKIVEWGERCGIPTPANRAIVSLARTRPVEVTLSPSP